MTPRVRQLLARARRRRGRFWLRRRWRNESLERTEGTPTPIRLALALENVLHKMPVTIVPNELIVGYHPESAAPPNVPPYISLWPDSAPLRMPEERRAMQANIYGSGPKTGHLTPNFRRLLAEGIDGILRRAEAPHENSTEAQDAEREAMAITLRATSHFIERYAARAEQDAKKGTRRARVRELRRIAEVCRHVAHSPARTFQEAAQLVWFGFLTECIENGEGTAAFALGRFDQYLFPYWDADRKAGVSRETLIELVASFWIKLNEFSGLQVLNMTIGGSDRSGNDAVNDLSFACLELMKEFRTATPSLSVRWHPKIDKRFFREAVRLATMGAGQPAFYGDPAAVKAMINAGVEPGDATDVVPGGCVELGIEGCCFPWVGNFFNMPKCLELALHDGCDSQTGERVGPPTGRLAALDTFEKLFDAYAKQVAYFLHLMAISENTSDRLLGEYSPYPFLSAIVDDCIDRGRDINCGGARYNFTEVQGVGIAHVVDSLLNVRQLVYENAETALGELVAKLDAGFDGDEPLRRRLQQMRPAYGDYSGESSELARRVVHQFYQEVERYTNPRGGTFRPGLLVWTLYDVWADCVGALPDGRRRGDALVSSIGPREQAGIESPTSILQDVTAFDHFRCAGGLTMNLRFDGGTVKTETGLDALMRLLEVYFERGGMQVQLNIADSRALRDAQEKPEAHAGLVVRVSGFSARFVEMSRRIQDEIIARAELDAR